MPVDRVVGLSKLARLIDVYARRLQTQEHMNAQIATAIDEILKPRGVAVMIEAEHTCMSVRGVAKPGAITVTTQFRGVFRDDPNGAGALHVHGTRVAGVKSLYDTPKGFPVSGSKPSSEVEEGWCSSPALTRPGS